MRTNAKIAASVIGACETAAQFAFTEIAAGEIDIIYFPAIVVLLKKVSHTL